jgi:hypothetical protein
MSKTWSDFSDQERNQLEQKFVYLHSLDILLRDSSEHEQTENVSFSDMFNALVENDSALTSNVISAVESNEKLKADFDLLLQRFSVFTLPKAAAASTGGVQARTLGEVEIRLIHSKAMAEQVFMLIKLPDSIQKSPNKMFIQTNENQLLFKDLPPLDEGVISLLLSIEDPFVAAFEDASSVLSLV